MAPGLNRSFIRPPIVVRGNLRSVLVDQLYFRIRQRAGDAERAKRRSQ